MKFSIKIISFHSSNFIKMYDFAPQGAASLVGNEKLFVLWLGIHTLGKINHANICQVGMVIVGGFGRELQFTGTHRNSGRDCQRTTLGHIRMDVPSMDRHSYQKHSRTLPKELRFDSHVAK
jgi:hypothetical protein